MAISPYWKHLQDVTPRMTDKQRVDLCMTACKVKQPTVSRWKTGINVWSRRHVMDIAREVGCTVDYLETGKGRKWPLPPPGADEERLLTMFRALPPSARPGILSYTQYVLERISKGEASDIGTVLAADVERWRK